MIYGEDNLARSTIFYELFRVLLLSENQLVNGYIMFYNV